MQIVYMAQIQFSEIGITGLRGRIKGTQFTRVRSGPQATYPTIPRQPGTNFQQYSQNQFQEVLRQWSLIEEWQRTAWDVAAEDPQWARLNKLGESYQPTGQSLFIQLNLSAYKQSFPINTPPDYPTFTTLAISSMIAVPNGEIEVDFSASTIDEEEIVLLFASGQLSRGRMSINQREYFFIENFDSETFTGLQDISDQYVVRWGEPIEGLKIFVRGELLHYPSGARMDLGWAKAVIQV
jgi:hypothetical protein